MENQFLLLLAFTNKKLILYIVEMIDYDFNINVTYDYI